MSIPSNMFRRIGGRLDGDPYFDNVLSLVHFDGADNSTTFTDTKGITWTNTGGKITTDPTYMGGSAGNFDGDTNGNITYVAPASWRLQQQFTMEFRIRPSITSAGMYWFGYACNANCWLYTSSTSNMRFHALGSEMPVNIPFVVGEWYHIALARDTTTMRLFVNGQLIYSVGSTTAITSGPTVGLGGIPQLAGPGRGGRCHFDEFRLTNGVCRYTTNFTPPNRPHPNVFGISTSDLYRDIVVSDVPTAYWRLNETSGTVLVDQTGTHNGSIGAISTIGQTKLVNNTEGTSFYFGMSTSTYTGKTSHADFNPGASDFAWEFWMKKDSPPSQAYAADGYLVVKDLGGVNYPVYMFKLESSGVMTWWCYTQNSQSGSITLSTPTSICDDVRHHIVGSRQGNVFTLYLDGVAVASINSNITLWSTNDPVAIGSSSTTGGINRGLNGWLDEVAYYKHHLPADRVAAHWNAGR